MKWSFKPLSLAFEFFKALLIWLILMPSGAAPGFWGYIVIFLILVTAQAKLTYKGDPL